MDESLGILNDLQGDLFPTRSVRISTKQHAERRGTFTDNMRLPMHRWFRYSAGFSAEWVQTIVKDAGGASCRVLDPFAGSGTTLIAARELGATAIGVEAHPFVARIAQAKLIRTVSPERLQVCAGTMLGRATSIADDMSLEPNALLQKCYAADALSELGRLKRAYYDLACESHERELLWLALTAILRECSHVGTAQWQYVLPNKSKSKVRMPFDAFRARIAMFCADLRQTKSESGYAKVVSADARSLTTEHIGTRQFDLVITSPPYPNNYDYADATRLEMSFWGEVENWSDLHFAVRKKLLVSCSQHSSAEKLDLQTVLSSSLLTPILPELSAVCKELAAVRETKGGKKTYHTMIAAYFLGLAQVWQALRQVMRDGSTVQYVIGDSAPYGVYVPCEQWLGELAIAAGFKSFSFTKLRDRNTKWKNRKHTVPLKEGLLRVLG